MVVVFVVVVAALGALNSDTVEPGQTHPTVAGAMNIVKYCVMYVQGFLVLVCREFQCQPKFEFKTACTGMSPFCVCVKQPENFCSQFSPFSDQFIG